MASKNITITNEAYDYLKSIKSDKSFSEVIMGLKENRNNIMSYAGIFKGSDLKINEVREQSRKDWDRR